MTVQVSLPLEYTVKSVLRGHLWDKAEVAL
jgi:hypothetical protein